MGYLSLSDLGLSRWGVVLMNLHLFGSSTNAGSAFMVLAASKGVLASVFPYSRRRSSVFQQTSFADLGQPDSFVPAGNLNSPAILVSFAPIWLLAPFFEQISLRQDNWLLGLRGVIVCSSSSVITKRFSANRFDRQLVARLTAAEDQILAICLRLSIPCRILRPTIIYGKVGAFGDRNLSRLLQQMRRLPVLPLPAETGLRQPIHATQLAAVALHLVEQLAETGLDSSLPNRLALGGDTTLTYTDMISALQKVQPLNDPARRCRLLPIPNRLFFLLAAPLLLRSPKAFEAVLRMGVDLSDFTPAHQLLGAEPQPFPLLPLA
jgi:hypothetical protein